MKRTLCFSLVCFFAFKGASQTLTPQNTNPQVGEVYNVAKGPYFNPGSSGMGQVWNFASQIPSPAASYTFLTPTQAGASNFSLCNMGRRNIEITNKFDLLNVSASGIDQAGYDSPSFPMFMFMGYIDARIELTYPMSAGVTFTDTWYGLTQTINSSWTTQGTETVTADGTGTLITFNSTYTNVLRVHTVTNFTETTIYSLTSPTITETFISDEYAWYSPGVHTPILIVKTYPAGPVPFSTFSVFYDLPANPVGIEQYNQINETLISVNNPADNELQIKLAKEEEGTVLIQLFDAAGRLVLFRNPEAGKQFAVDVSNLENGLYYLKAVLNDRAVCQKKIVVQH